MINGLEGIPGSGKSYEAVVYHVLEALKAGRKVVTNLSLVVDMFAAIDPGYRALIELRRRPKPILGTWDANRMDDDGNGHAFQLWEVGSHVMLPTGASVVIEAGGIRPSEDVAVFGHVWDFYDTWKHPVTGLGPLYVIDECHVPMPKVGTDVQVVQWFKLHRHFNADVLLMTQSFRDMCTAIAVLMGVLIKCRKADILGRKGSYIRKVHGGYRGAVISTEERKYLPQMFPLYKSHTQGSSVAEATAQDVAPFVVKFRRFTWVWWLFTAGALAWAFWPASKPAPAKSFAPAKTANKGPQNAQPGLAKPGTTVLHAGNEGIQNSQPGLAKPDTKVSSDGEAQETKVLEPYAGKGIHLTGSLWRGSRVVHTFAVSDQGRRIFDITDAEFTRAGYRWEPVAECAGVLHWGGKSRLVSCDPPVFSVGLSSKPVVIDSASGSRSDQPLKGPPS
jgi:zona occludens toxin